MEKKVNFLGYVVREINFLRNDHYKPEKMNLDMKLAKNATYLDNNRVRFNVNVKIFEEAVSKNYPFSLSFVLSGLFQYVDINIDVDENRDILEYQMIDIIYPYIRTIVSSVLTTANLPPIFLPTIDISKLSNKMEKMN